MSQQLRTRAFGDAPDAAPAGQAHPCQQAGVITLQSMLVAQGYDLSVDGVYGPRTRAAMQQYQRRSGLTVTTYPDAPTLTRLNIPSMQSTVIEHARLSAQCLSQRAGTATGTAASGGTADTGISIERVDPGGLMSRLGQVEWYWWVLGLAVVTGGGAFAAAALKKSKRRGR
jgi:hypothetical protein